MSHLLGGALCLARSYLFLQLCAGHPPPGYRCQQPATSPTITIPGEHHPLVTLSSLGQEPSPWGAPPPAGPGMADGVEWPAPYDPRDGALAYHEFEGRLEQSVILRARLHEQEPWQLALAFSNALLGLVGKRVQPTAAIVHNPAWGPAVAAVEAARVSALAPGAAAAAKEAVVAAVEGLKAVLRAEYGEVRWADYQAAIADLCAEVERDGYVSEIALSRLHLLWEGLPAGDRSAEGSECEEGAVRRLFLRICHVSVRIDLSSQLQGQEWSWANLIQAAASDRKLRMRLRGYQSGVFPTATAAQASSTEGSSDKKAQQLRFLWESDPMAGCPLHKGAHSVWDCGVIELLVENPGMSLEQATRTNNQQRGREARAANRPAGGGVPRGR